MPNTTQTMGSETTDEDTDTGEDYDRVGLKRAAVVEQYNKLADIRPPETDESADAEDTTIDEEPGMEPGASIWTVARELISPTRIRRNIVDLETRPELELDTIEEARESPRVEHVRFVFEDQETTRWYEFAPGSELTNIIDFYADGDFAALFAPDTSVDVASTDPVIAGEWEILYPEPYEKHTGHLKYPGTRRVHELSQITTATSDTTLGEGGAQSVSALISLSLYPILAIALIGIPGLTQLALVDEVILATLVAFVGHFVVGMFFGMYDFNHAPEDHYRYALMPVSIPALRFVKCISLLWSGLVRCLAQLNNRQR